MKYIGYFMGYFFIFLFDIIATISPSFNIYKFLLIALFLASWYFGLIKKIQYGCILYGIISYPCSYFPKLTITIVVIMIFWIFYPILYCVITGTQYRV